ncbi:hypothetical protein BBJ28_00005375 [Nothophytophthora sp. Chile5]|nr:hypothetical protein BBJ28_00005375 [Nothophytophthora sp. Chile5]
MTKATWKDTISSAAWRRRSGSDRPKCVPEPRTAASWRNFDEFIRGCAFVVEQLLLSQLFLDATGKGDGAELRVSLDVFTKVIAARLRKPELLEDVRRLFKAMDLRAEGFISFQSFQKVGQPLRSRAEATDGDASNEDVGDASDASRGQPTRWATVTHGGFLCTQCAGVHRSLGVHVSFVLSATLDKWTGEQVQAMETTGNARLNLELERTLAQHQQHQQTQQFPTKPAASTPRAERERFIRAKYEQRLFTASPVPLGALSPPPVADKLSASKPPSTTSQGMVEYVGVLTIELKEAAGLAGMNISGKSDPYVTFRLGEQHISSKRVDNSVDPQWHQQLLLSWDGTSPLEAELFDYNKVSPDRPMGAFAVDATTLATLSEASEPRDAWFPVAMPREWASNFGEHLVAGAEGVGKGFYRGITGVWKDPIKGARKNGLEGFAKGVGIGVAGVVYRPIKGLGTMVKHSALSVGVGKKSKRSSSDSDSSSPDDSDLVAAGAVRLALSLQTFS